MSWSLLTSIGPYRMGKLRNVCKYHIDFAYDLLKEDTPLYSCYEQDVLRQIVYRANLFFLCARVPRAFLAQPRFDDDTKTLSFKWETANSARDEPVIIASVDSFQRTYCTIKLWSPLAVPVEFKLHWKNGVDDMLAIMRHVFWLADIHASAYPTKSLKRSCTRRGTEYGKKMETDEDDDDE